MLSKKMRFVNICRAGRKVIENARGVCKAGDTDPLIRRVAGSKNSGSAGQNAARVLLNTFCRTDAEKLIVPIADAACTHILYPHELFAFLLENHPGEFKRRFSAEPEQLAYFWSGLRSSVGGAELFDSHPFLKDRSPRELAFTIPIVVHSDAGPFSKNLGMQIVQWGSLLGKGADIEQRFVSMVWLSKYGQSSSHKGTSL